MSPILKKRHVPNFPISGEGWGEGSYRASSPGNQVEIAGT